MKITKLILEVMKIVTIIPAHHDWLPKFEAMELLNNTVHYWRLGHEYILQAGS